MFWYVTNMSFNFDNIMLANIPRIIVSVGTIINEATSIGYTKLNDDKH